MNIEWVIVFMASVVVSLMLSSRGRRSRDSEMFIPTADLSGRVAELERKLAYLYQQFELQGADIPSETPAEIRELLTKRRKIEAIKVYRSYYNVGLKEAKEAVETMQQGLGL